MKSMPIFASALALLLAAGPAVAATGSGTVEFRFTNFFGPHELVLPPNPGFHDGITITGTVNGVTPTPLGPPQPTGRTTGFSAGSFYNTGLVGATISGGTFPLTGTPTTTVSLLTDASDAGTPFENLFTWTPASFSGVSTGQEFRLGTLTFQNGSWFGGGATSAFNTPTILGFRVTTTSSTPEFNQSRNLVLIHTVNAPDNNDTSTDAGKDAAADWVTIYDQENDVTLNSFRVYDNNQTPAGFTNVGSVDLMGRFGSLGITGFANPVGGFITASSDPLPSVPFPPGPGGGGGAIPEPASWAMLIAGFGLIGAVARRRRLRLV
ncbi:MAG: PEPxxWA-CTERM sorting domain-containing protein [Alphaproteobacteria bacterium]|nr:PEPxxWA-CTERM sorting domain-containing protein [Alphaproteobacteria bacterium]